MKKEIVKTISVGSVLVKLQYICYCDSEECLRRYLMTVCHSEKCVGIPYEFYGFNRKGNPVVKAWYKERLSRGQQRKVFSAIARELGMTKKQLVSLMGYASWFTSVRP